ncbi:tetratricopeptide repeat protein [Rhodococcus sp. Leaf278]|uniref:tetratricopeptide repeat protein n=1 Tax=Rhodococcus sp. Leaf278 TaxID=1736319 RepID=UPI000A6E9A6A|nr:sel1 repeat family protein [Rhodococcus sp. Leaf278]
MVSETDKAPYKAWLAELDRVMTRRDVATAMREYVRAHQHLWALDDRPTTRDKWMKGSSAAQLDVLANNVGRWIGGSVPGPNILKMALISVVDRAVPEAPDSVRQLGQWGGFADVLDAADTSNRSGQKRGGAAAKHKAQQDHAEKTANVVRAAGRPDDIDAARDLEIGSSLFDDALPPYVARTADTLVAARLGDPRNHPITVIVGPPKSGKTRSLFHLLSAATPQPVTWWHNPAPGALDTLITRLDAVKNDPARPDVVILDDAGYNGVTPDTGLTAPRIRKIASLTTSVVLIVHSADLASWKDHATGGRSAGGLETMMGIGASPTLVNLLDANTVDYSAELDDTELAAASQMLTDNDSSDLQGLDLTRLAEAMATVGKLHAAVQAASEHGGMRAALVDAAIDATITDPAGVDVDWLQTLTQIHYRRLARNARWQPAQFDIEFDDWATVGFSPGSPHAVLIRTDTHTPDSHGGERYRLLDALTPRLRAPDRDLTHLDPTTLHTARILRTSDFLIAHRRYDTAATWLLPAAHRGDPDSLLKLGSVTHEIGPEALVDGRAATGWWALAANRGDPAAAHNLGVTAQAIGFDAVIEGHTATEWRLIAADNGIAATAFNLGNAANQLGPDAAIEGHTATEWWRIAADNGNIGAAHNLGVTADKAGPNAVIENRMVENRRRQRKHRCGP